MTLNNLYVFIGGCIRNAFTSGTTFTDIVGKSTSSTPNSVANNFMNDTGKIILGKSEHPTLSASDYNIDDPCELTLISNNKQYNTTSGLGVIATTTYKNNTESAVTITNVGLVSYNILLTKEILSTPVTMQPGESYTFTAMIGA